MNLSHPLTELMPGARGALLGVLMRLEVPVTRRELARLAGVAHGNGGLVVDQLVASGVVHEQRAGRASMVSLNRNHIQAQSLLALAGPRRELTQRLAGRMAEWPGLHAAWLFGSTARGDGDSASDVDVLLVAERLDDVEAHARITDLHMDVVEWTGNQLQLVECSPGYWHEQVAARVPLVDAIRRDGIALTPDAQAVLAGS